jgi:hypothetical protein
MRRYFSLIAAACLAFGFALAPTRAAHADIPATVATYGSTAYATGTHVIVFTDAYPNFATGALDNHYPLAKARQDGSPLADATATYSDVGPFVNTVAACSNSDPSQCQNKVGVPYANAHFPGGKTADHVDSCTPSAQASGQANPCPNNGQPASYADTNAGELSANASGFYAGGGTQPFSGASGETKTIVNADGSILVTTHSTVLSATFGGGAIQISKVEVTTRATSASGQATADAQVKVGQVLINGQATSVDDKGVTVQQNLVVPCAAPASPPPAIPPPLGSSQPSTPSNCLPQVELETFKLYMVAPKKTITGNHAVVSASGLHVLVTQPSAPGAPNQHVEYVFGEGFADAQLSPNDNAAAGASTDMTGTDMSESDIGGTDMSGDMSGDNGAPAGAAATAPAQKAAAVFVTNNRRPLALLFLFWECVVMASAAAWVWSRRAAVREAAAAAAAEVT